MEHNYDRSPLTLRVDDLASSTSFYLAALQPLGYTFISQVQHQTSQSTSQAVGIGPENTERIDVFLSQSGHPSPTSTDPKFAHVVFPTTSRVAVRDFYTAALNAGGRPVSRPDWQGNSQETFAAIVADSDGNQIEVFYCDAVNETADINVDPNNGAIIPASRAEASINGWRENLPDASATTEAPRPRAPFTASKRTVLRTNGSPQPTPSMAPSRSGTYHSRREAPPLGTSTSAKAKSGSESTPAIDVPGGKAVVGTLLGAAAGAALAYTMTRSKQDSSRREGDFHAHMAERDRIKSEAKAHAMLYSTSPDSPWRSKARSGRQEFADRDSGYYSSSSRRDISPRGRAVRRSETFPQPSVSSVRSASSHGQKTTCMIEYPPKPVSEASYSERVRRSNRSETSQSTIRPSRNNEVAIITTKQRRGSPTQSSIRPPSPPPPPDARPRYSLSRSQSLRSNDRHSNPRPGGSKTAANPPPPSSYHPPTMVRRSSSVGSSGRRSRHDDDRAAASRRDSPPPSYRRSQVSERRDFATSSPDKPLSRAPSSRHSNAGSLALTSRALSAHTAKTGSRNVTESSHGALDDLETLAPDDSISCAPEDPPPRRSHAPASLSTSHRVSGSRRGVGHSSRTAGRSGLVAG